VEIFTLNVGQGQFVAVTGNTEAFIVDTYLPLNPEVEIVNVKAALAAILPGKNLIGLMVTGFDADHFNEIGLKLVLNKYRPDWIMYPKYFKETGNARTCFAAIKSFERQKSEFRKISMDLSDNDKRFYYKLSNDFTFELFSPHRDDMTSSNNCSLVCKVEEKATGRSYLITGDTEGDRWDSIVYYFDSSLASTVLAAPHHGSVNGISEVAIASISPHTVLISAGVDNQYGHPDIEAMRLFRKYATDVWQTNARDGQSLRTVVTAQGVRSYKFEP
jgi:beta-lactamase superfamily II metal-dependent hydrolase